MAEGKRRDGGAVGRGGYLKHKRRHSSHTLEGRLLMLCFLSPSVVILGFKLHWGSSVQQDVSCLLLMHRCKVFDVHYRLKKKSALCILHQCQQCFLIYGSKYCFNFRLLRDVWISSSSFLFFLPVRFNKKKKKKGKKGIFSSIVRSDM